MKTRILFLVTCILLIHTIGRSQAFEVPDEYVLKTADDYVQYEDEVIDAAKWLVNTPLTDQLSKRRAVSKFVVDWVNGSPTVTVEINMTILNFDEKNPGMLVIYMASSARYVLENDYSKDITAKHAAALNDMIEVYQKGIGIEKDKKMEKLIAAKEEGKMDDWMHDNLNMGK